MMECKDPKPFYSIGVSSVAVAVAVAATTENTVDGAQSEPVPPAVVVNNVGNAHGSGLIDDVPGTQQVVLENGISGIKSSFKSEAVMEYVDAAVESNETSTAPLDTISTTDVAEKAIINANDNENVKIGQKDAEQPALEPQIDSKSSITIIAAKDSSQISESVPASTVNLAPETPQAPEKRSEPMKIIKSEVTFDETVTANIDDRSIAVTTHLIKGEYQPDDGTVAEATVSVTEITHPVTETTAQVIKITTPDAKKPVLEAKSTALDAKTSASDAKTPDPDPVPVIETTHPVTETMAPVAESTVPVTETTNLVAKKSPSKSPKQKSPPKQKGKIREVNSDLVVATKATVSVKASVAPVNVTSNGKRIRFKTQMYQAPLPEEDALLSKLSNSVHVKNDRVIVFKKLEFIAVRSPENSFFICRTLNNINKKSKKCRIQWLAKSDKDKNDVYTNDFYDVVDFETILTNVKMNRVNKNQFSLPPKEKERVQRILKEVLDVESGVAMPSTDNVDDGIDISQISNTTLDESPSSKRSSRSADSSESTVRKSRKRSVSKSKKRSASVSVQEPNSGSVRRSNRTANTSIAPPVPVDEDESEEMVPTGSRTRTATATANKRSMTKNVAATPVPTTKSKSSTKSTKSTPKTSKSNAKAAKKDVITPAVAAITTTTVTSKRKTVSATVEKRLAAVVAESKKGNKAAKVDTNLPVKAITTANNKKNEPKPKATTTVADGKVTKKRQRRKRSRY